MDDDIDDSFMAVIRLSISKNLDRVSNTALDKICESIIEFAGGDMIYIPKETGKKLIERNIKINQDHEAGMSARSLSAKYRLSIKQIARITKT